MSDVLVEIRSRLARYPDLIVVETPSSIAVRPQDDSGFEVGLSVAGGECTVHMEGWHEHFASEAEALNCFAFGLSTACRLLIEYRGKTPVRWTVESIRGGRWVVESTTGLLLTPFWRPRRLSHKQNRLLDSEAAQQGHAAGRPKAAGG